MSIIGYILIGSLMFKIQGSSEFIGIPPPSVIFVDKESCEKVKLISIEMAYFGTLKCVQTSIISK